MDSSGQSRGPRRSRAVVIALTLAGVVVAGGAGAGVYAALDDSPGPAATVTVTAAGATVTATAATAPPGETEGSEAGGLPVEEISAEAGPGVVEISVLLDSSASGAGSPQEEAQGAGFVLDEGGHIVTAQHVVEGARSISVTLADGSRYRARLVAADPSTDLAVVAIDAPAGALHPLVLGDSDALAVGDGVVAVGDPYGFRNSVTSGIVSALDREIPAPDGSAIAGAIQTDAAINLGNSGGPLLDRRGEVVGVAAQIQSTSGGSDGVGFAVPANTVARVVHQLLRDGKAVSARLGVAVMTVPESVAAVVDTAAGVAVAEVEDASPAQAAGIRAAASTRKVGGIPYPVGGDRIAALDGTPVATAQALRRLLAAHEPGERVELTILRAGATITLGVTLAAR